jgi:hypothetical protein
LGEAAGVHDGHVLRFALGIKAAHDEAVKVVVVGELACLTNSNAQSKQPSARARRTCTGSAVAVPVAALKPK